MEDVKYEKKILLALDKISIDECKKDLIEIADFIGGFKIGLEFFNFNGIQGIKSLQKNSKINNLKLFLDLKFHDIPNTIRGAIRSVFQVFPDILNVHIAGGYEMMCAAKDETVKLANKYNVKTPKLIGVSILTSLNDEDVFTIGYKNNVKKQVIEMAKLAKKSGLDGIVCSAYEVKEIKEICGNDFLTVVPGIRFCSENNDQLRVISPKNAAKLGSDYMVIGRSITEHSNKKKIAEKIKNSFYE